MERLLGIIARLNERPIHRLQHDAIWFENRPFVLAGEIRDQPLGFREQISCFGPDGLLRRHDYTVDMLGGATGLNYASNYRNVDGIIVPAKRRICAYEGDYQLVKEPLLVSIDMGEIALE